MLVFCSNSVATKKGKSEGITEVTKSSNPLFTAGKLVLEKISSPKVKKINKTVKKFLFNLTAYILHLENMNFSFPILIILIYY